MADNVAVTAGSGTTIGADEVVDGTLGTVKVQYVKLMDGTLDGTTKGVIGAAGLKVDLSGTAANSTAVKVDNSAVTQPVSAASLPLPTGAATAAKQPALGTAGTASADVISVQGVASMTALKVDGSAVTQPVSGTFWQATQPVSGTVTANGGTGNFASTVADGANVTLGAKADAANTATDTTAVSGISVLKQISKSVQQLVTDVGTLTTSFGQSYSRVVAAASTNATSVKASAGNITNVDLFNVAAYDVFVKFYNKASAPTVGTDTPVWTVPIKAGTGFSKQFPNGRWFSTGVAFAITKLQADSDTTVVAAGDVTGQVEYI